MPADTTFTCIPRLICKPVCALSVMEKMEPLWKQSWGPFIPMDLEPLLFVLVQIWMAKQSILCGNYDLFFQLVCQLPRNVI